MGREIQKKKNRSGVQKIRQKPKSKKKLLQHPLIAANWDKSATLEQNYRRLGLTAKLNKHTGGTEKKAEDVRRMRDEMANEGEGGMRKKDDALAISTVQKRKERLDVHEVRIERDPKTGAILRVVEGQEGKGRRRANPLNDPLNELDSDEEDDDDDDHEEEVRRGAAKELFDQHGHVTPAAAVDGGDDEKTEVVRQLEQEAGKVVPRRKQHQSEGERAFVVELVRKYGDDYARMARDTEINYMQRSAGDLKRRVKKWREGVGKMD